MVWRSLQLSNWLRSPSLASCLHSLLFHFHVGTVRIATKINDRRYPTFGLLRWFLWYASLIGASLLSHWSIKVDLSPTLLWPSKSGEALISTVLPGSDNPGQAVFRGAMTL